MNDDGWIRAATIDDLHEGKGSRVTVGADTVLLVRSGDRVFAIENRCTHQGAALDRGRGEGLGLPRHRDLPGPRQHVRTRRRACAARTRDETGVLLRREDRGGGRRDPPTTMTRGPQLSSTSAQGSAAPIANARITRTGDDFATLRPTRGDRDDQQPGRDEQQRPDGEQRQVTHRHQQTGATGRREVSRFRRAEHHCPDRAGDREQEEHGDRRNPPRVCRVDWFAMSQM